MVPAFNLMSCPNLAVSTEVMQHVVQAESGTNPFAIGVVGGKLERQPRNLGEAVATARMLESRGYDYSLGIAQVNRSNLARYGLDTFAKAFDGCANLAAGARILAECYGRSGGDWGKAFSCYYSGDFTTGYREGYVQRVYHAFNTSIASASEPIAVYPQSRERSGETSTSARLPVRPGTPAYRASIRSVAFDSTASVSVYAITQAAAPSSPGKATPTSQPIPTAAKAEAPGVPGDTAFVPRVSGPVAEAATAEPAPPGDSPDAAVTGPAVPDPETSDAAFVF
jgi:type IV secretion system protein VirB1